MGTLLSAIHRFHRAGEPEAELPVGDFEPHRTADGGSS